MEATAPIWAPPIYAAPIYAASIYAAPRTHLDDEFQLEPLVGLREPHALRDAAHGAAHASHGDPDVRPQEGGGEALDGAQA